jgi:muramoyltetrapeptide carboxypeptidase LdcA involved in peptidoglycan recycling
MIKPKRLQPGDTVAIVSLSSGILGEPSASHQLAIAERRLEDLGLKFKYMPHSKKGLEYIRNNPKARASDLKDAFKDDSVKAIICAIGGDDTYKALPYLFEDHEFIALVQNNPKIFLGFSDTTNNHLMFYKLGLQTYYGQALLTDIAEFADEMLPYSKGWLDELFNPHSSKEIVSSNVWYDEREAFGPDQVGTNRKSHDEISGLEVLRGSGTIEGELLGGCIDSLHDNLSGERYSEEKSIIEKYGIFPYAEEWVGKILFAETSEERPDPEKLKTMLTALDSAGVFAGVKAILVGKPQNEVYYQEYKDVWLEATKKYDTPILYNLNIGHAAPRCILPYGGRVRIDFDESRIILLESLVR